MARARNIKPALYLDEELAELKIATRYLFTGLWCLADKEGRMEDRPKWIKAQIYPYDSYNTDELLEELFKSGHIIRYEVEEKRYIQVANFVKHQNPHKNEKPSEYPACDSSRVITRKNMNDTDKIGTTRADSLLLIPDSLNLIPEKYNELCPSLPKVTKLTETRKKTLSARLKSFSEEQLLTAFKKAEASYFLKGNNDRNWKADFDWILSENNLVKILEGRYDGYGNENASEERAKAHACLKDCADLPCRAVIKKKQINSFCTYCERGKVLEVSKG